MTGIKSSVHTNRVPQHRPAMHTAVPSESIADLTRDPQSWIAGEGPVRWSGFRSGYVDIHLSPLSNDSRASLLGPNTDVRTSVHPKESQEVIGQRENMPVSPSSDTLPHLAQSNNRINDTIPVRSTEDSQIGGHLSVQFRQRYAIEAVPSSFFKDSLAVLGGEVETVSSSPVHSTLVRGFTFAGIIPLSLGSHDRPRRLLCDGDSTYVVTAHGVIDKVSATDVLKLDRNIRSPPLPFDEFVHDACILPHLGEPVIILGHAREQNQISLLNLSHSQVNVTVK